MDRGRLEVGTASWHWRWYSFWKDKKGDTRSQVDLCHYVRVLLLWAPMRWFFQSSADRWGVITPFVVAGWSALIGFIVYALVAWHDATLTVLIWVGLGLAAIAVVVTVAWVLALLIRRDPEAWVRTLKWIGRAIAKPFVLIGRAARTTAPFWRWLDRTHWIGPVPFHPMVVLFVAGGLFVLILNLVLHWLATLVVIGSVIGGIALLIGCIALGIWIHDRYKERPPKMGMGSRTVAWEFLKAKKHRVCPLIEAK